MIKPSSLLFSQLLSKLCLLCRQKCLLFVLVPTESNTSRVPRKWFGSADFETIYTIYLSLNHNQLIRTHFEAHIVSDFVFLPLIPNILGQSYPNTLIVFKHLPLQTRLGHRVWRGKSLNTPSCPDNFALHFILVVCKLGEVGFHVERDGENVASAAEQILASK